MALNATDNNQSLYGFCDANYGEDKLDRKSNSGYVLKLNGGVINWCCKNQKLVSLSFTEAEFISLCETVKEISYIKNILYESQAIILYEDNQSTIKMLSNERKSQRTKHINIRYHYVRDTIANEQIEVKYCPTEIMLADMMTKISSL